MAACRCCRLDEAKHSQHRRTRRPPRTRAQGRPRRATRRSGNRAGSVRHRPPTRRRSRGTGRPGFGSPARHGAPAERRRIDRGVSPHWLHARPRGRRAGRRRGRLGRPHGLDAGCDRPWQLALPRRRHAGMAGRRTAADPGTHPGRAFRGRESSSTVGPSPKRRTSSGVSATRTW